MRDPITGLQSLAWESLPLELQWHLDAQMNAAVGGKNSMFSASQRRERLSEPLIFFAALCDEMYNMAPPPPHQHQMNMKQHNQMMNTRVEQQQASTSNNKLSLSLLDTPPMTGRTDASNGSSSSSAVIPHFNSFHTQTQVTYNQRNLYRVDDSGGAAATAEQCHSSKDNIIPSILVVTRTEVLVFNVATGAGAATSTSDSRLTLLHAIPIEEITAIGTEEGVSAFSSSDSADSATATATATDRNSSSSIDNNVLLYKHVVISTRNRNEVEVDSDDTDVDRDDQEAAVSSSDANTDRLRQKDVLIRLCCDDDESVDDDDDVVTFNGTGDAQHQQQQIQKQKELRQRRRRYRLEKTVTGLVRSLQILRRVNNELMADPAKKLEEKLQKHAQEEERKEEKNKRRKRQNDEQEQHNKKVQFQTKGGNPDEHHTGMTISHYKEEPSSVVAPAESSTPVAAAAAAAAAPPPTAFVLLSSNSQIEVEVFPTIGGHNQHQNQKEDPYSDVFEWFRIRRVLDPSNPLPSPPPPPLLLPPRRRSTTTDDGEGDDGGEGEKGGDSRNSENGAAPAPPRFITLFENLEDFALQGDTSMVELQRKQEELARLQVALTETAKAGWHLRHKTYTETVDKAFERRTSHALMMRAAVDEAGRIQHDVLDTTEAELGKIFEFMQRAALQKQKSHAKIRHVATMEIERRMKELDAELARVEATSTDVAWDIAQTKQSADLDLVRLNSVRVEAAAATTARQHQQHDDSVISVTTSTNNIPAGVVVELDNPDPQYHTPYGNEQENANASGGGTEANETAEDVHRGTQQLMQRAAELEALKQKLQASIASEESDLKTTLHEVVAENKSLQSDILETKQQVRERKAERARLEGHLLALRHREKQMSKKYDVAPQQNAHQQQQKQQPASVSLETLERRRLAKEKIKKQREELMLADLERGSLIQNSMVHSMMNLRMATMSASGQQHQQL